MGIEMGDFFTYMALCADGTLYTGWTTNLVRRIAAHNGAGCAGAKYTRMRRPVTLVFAERHDTKSEAMSREWHIKKMTRKEKMRLIGWE
ncbi:MAG: GIY-YIG nuclease family protein [Bacteroidales bacterium]|nr:GIY-YIG nuclease family protein [Bacteroidales bacterium]MDY4175617.1 GIY-YIG nuclease family protein [Bacteroidales bacterium]